MTSDIVEHAASSGICHRVIRQQVISTSFSEKAADGMEPKSLACRFLVQSEWPWEMIGYNEKSGEHGRRSSLDQHAQIRWVFSTHVRAVRRSLPRGDQAVKV